MPGAVPGVTNVYLSNGSGFDPATGWDNIPTNWGTVVTESPSPNAEDDAVNTALVAGGAPSLNSRRVLPGDFNGDGRTDLMVMWLSNISSTEWPDRQVELQDIHFDGQEVRHSGSAICRLESSVQVGLLAGGRCQR